MSNPGQAVLTIAGTVVGAYFGNPQLGYLLGSLAGQALFPTQLPDANGPRLKELNIQTSTVGVAVPIVYGTYQLAGNIIWAQDLVEVKNKEESGGKGGPHQTVNTYSYFGVFAVGICEGEIQGIRRIWADAVVIYDRSPQGVAESDDDYHARIATSQQTEALMTVYRGTETQVADPTIESYEGVGLVAGYRGLAYVVFDQLPLENYGNRIPNLRFEVFTGTADTSDCSEYSAGHLEPWAYMDMSNTYYDPRNPLNKHLYGYTENGGNIVDSFEVALAEMNNASDHPTQGYIIGVDPQIGDSIYVQGWATNTTPNFLNPCDNSPDFLDYINVQMHLTPVRITNRACSGDIPSNDCSGWATLLGGLGQPLYVSVGQFSGVNVMTNHDEDPAPYFAGIPFTSTDSHRLFDCTTYDIWRLNAHLLGVTRTTEPPDPCDGGTPISNAPGYCISADGVITRAATWVKTTGTWHVLRKYDTDGSLLVTSYPLSPARPSTDPDYNNQTFWEAAYAAAVAAGDIEAGLVYGVDYPQSQSYAYVSTCETSAIDTVCVPIADIVDDICSRAGLTAIDTSDLGACVDGYCITRVMTARDALEPLRTYGLFDAVESGTTLKFIERGHSSVATLTADDIGAYESSQDRPTVTEIARIQEKELPRRLRLHYASPERNYEPGEQSSSRITTEAITESDVALPISMPDDNAAQLAEILLYDAWISRNTYRFSVDNSWLKLEPTDCIVIPIDGEAQRVRITGVEYGIGGIMRIDAVRDDEDAYASTATGHPPSSSGGTTPTPLVCPSKAIYLDLPALRQGDTDAGYYAAVYGLCETWACAAIYRSSDGGVTYSRVAQTDVEATVGTVIDQDTAGNIYLTLDTIGATLESITTDQRDAGQNVAAVGSDGQWEIIQFQTATLNSGGVWELSDIVRGLDQTTSYAPAAAGERFVLLTGPGILRIAETSLGIGVEKQLKVVTCGESVESAVAVDFTTQGLSYVPPLTGTGPVVVDPTDNTVTLDPAANLDNNARVGVRKNSTGSTFLRRRINLIEGSNVTMTVADDSTNEEVDVTISTTGGGGGYPPQLGHSGI